MRTVCSNTKKKKTTLSKDDSARVTAFRFFGSPLIRAGRGRRFLRHDKGGLRSIMTDLSGTVISEEATA